MKINKIIFLMLLMLGFYGKIGLAANVAGLAMLQAKDAEPVILTDVILQKLADTTSDPVVKQLENDDDQTTSNSASIAPLVNKINSNPTAVQALNRHGFSARTYVSSLVTLLQSSVAAHAQSQPARQKLLGDIVVNPANVSYVKTHPAEVQKIFLSSTSAEDQADASHQIERIKKMPPGMIGECTKVSMSLLPILPLAQRGSSKTSGADVIKLADGIENVSKTLKHERPKNDFSDIAVELRTHASERPIASSKLAAALDDVKIWTEQNCNPK